jgi:KaiC/GvpD/RAD55 family RecA-like ATPase
VNTIRADQEYKHLKNWIKPLDTSIYQADAQSRRSQGSGEWLLENSQFQSWQNGLQNFLWLFGLPGCGKTILSSTVIEALVRSGRTCLYFYITFQDHATLSFNNILRSLLWQLCVQSDSSRAVLDSLYCSCRNGSSDDARAPSINELREAFRKMLQLSQQVWLVIDALDEIAIEASKGVCKDLIEWITEMVAKHGNLFILVTSRDEEHIRSPFERMCGDDRSLSISGEGLDHDLERYIKNGISASRQLGIRWAKRRDMLGLIKERLMAKADGM